MPKPVIQVCRPVELPVNRRVTAAVRAISINPANRPHPTALRRMLAEATTGLVVPGAAPRLTVGHLAAATTAYWGVGGVKLTVGFMETISDGLADKIVAYANKWGQFGNVTFVRSKTSPQIRVTRSGKEYYSYLGTGILSIPRTQHTMMLGGFTEKTPDSEFDRVVVHEFGHSLGLIHEHLRQAEVDKLDPQKTIAFFERQYGWDAQTTRDQVLTADPESDLIGTAVADETSIMCYQIPGACTKTGVPIVGGLTLSEMDKQWIARLYPKAAPPPPDAATYLDVKVPGRYVLQKG